MQIKSSKFLKLFTNYLIKIVTCISFIKFILVVDLTTNLNDTGKSI